MRHFLNDIEIAPRNILSIGVQSTFTDRQDWLEVDVDRLILPREALPIFEQHLQLYGPFEGIPYTIQLNGGQVLEYYVDLQEDTIYRDWEIECKIKRRGGNDNFFDQADGTSWEIMAKKGVIFEPFDIPYVIVVDDPIPALLTFTVTIYVITKDVINQVQQIQEGITDIIDTLPPLPANAGQIATLVIKVLIRVAVLTLTVIALLKLLQQFFEIIFPKIRFFQGHKIKRLIELGCQYLGYSFQSTLLDGLSGLTLLPVPLVKDKDSFWDFLQNDLNFAYTKGYPTAQDTTPTLGSLLTALETQFNARTRVRNGIVYLEGRLYWQDIANQTIVPALNIQADRQSEYTLNTEDIWKRYYVHYQTDFSDLNTIDFYDPTDCEYSTEPVLIGNADLVSIRGLNDVNIPFALGVRKNKLNFLEKTAKLFFEFADNVVFGFGGYSNFTALIQNRIGVMIVSQQFYSTTKMLYTIGGKQPANYTDLISANSIYQQHHKINEIAINDFKIFKDAPVRMNDEIFVTLLTNNYVEIDGKICELLSITYKDEQSIASISYKQPFDYANGKTNVLTIND